MSVFGTMRVAFGKGSVALLLVTLGAWGGAARAGEGLLAERSDARSTAAVVQQLKASGPIEALLRARFFWAETYLSGDAQLGAWSDNVRDGLASLSATLGRPLGSFEELDQHLGAVPKAAVGVLFWSALSYADTIPSISLFKRLPAAKRFKRALERALVLDESYFFAGPHRVLASFLARAPRLFGGDMPLALTHAKRALELAPGFAQVTVDAVEVRILAKEPRRDAEGALRAALRLPAPDAASAPEQHAAQKRAQAILDGAKVE
jgi:hypothetical protein